MKRPQTRIALGLASWLVLACACNGTETDNPVATGTESPIDFVPPTDIPPCDPGDSDEPPQQVPSAHDERTLALVDKGQLLLVDVADAGAPSVLSRTPLTGTLHQLLLEGDALTLVLDEAPVFDGVPPARADLTAQTHVVRFDISDRAAPRRVAEHAVAGEFWQLMPRADGYWLVAARLESWSESCFQPYNLCGSVLRGGITLDHLVFDGAAFVATEHRELPYLDRVFIAPGGVATRSEGALHVAAFDGAGGLLPTRDLPFDEYVYASSVAITPEYIALLAPGLQLIGLDGTSLGSSTQPNTPGAHATFVGSTLFSAGSRLVPGTFIDFSDTAAPRVTALQGVAEVVPLRPADGTPATRAVGWFQDDAGLRFSLLSLETSPPSVLDSLTTREYRVDDSEGRLTSDAGHVFFEATNAGYQRVLGEVLAAGDRLELRALEGSDVDAALGVGDFSYVDTGQGYALHGAEGAPLRLELNPGTVLDSATGTAGRATLLVREDGSRRLQLEHAGATEAIELGAEASRVLEAGERWLVFNLQNGGVCPAPPCSASVSIVGGQPAAVLAEIPLPFSSVVADRSVPQATDRWLLQDAAQGPLRLGASRYALLRDLTATCTTVAECAALGIEAGAPPPNLNPASEETCPPSDTSDEPCEASTPAPSPSAYANVTRRAFFVLDAAAETLSAPAEIDAPGDGYWSWRANSILLAPGEPESLLALRLEPTRPSGDRPVRARFVLERVSTAGLEPVHTGSNVVPGYPVALLDAETLLSVQPVAAGDGSALLLRSQLSAGGAAIQQRQLLEPRLMDATVAGDYAVYLNTPAEACAGLVLSSYALADLAPAGRVELPGIYTESLGALPPELILASDASSVVVRDQAWTAFTRVQVGADGALQVAGVVSVPLGLYGARWRDGVLFGVSGGEPVELPL